MFTEKFIAFSGLLKQQQGDEDVILYERSKKVKGFHEGSLLLMF